MTEESKQPNPQQKRIGRGMFYIAWIIALVLLTYIAGYWEEQQQNPNRNPTSSYQQGFIEVPLKRNRWGHYATSGAINRQPVYFLLDTGASEVSIPEHIATDLGLRRGIELPRMTANGTIVVYATRIDELTIGDILLRDIPASINPHSSDDVILLGMSALKEIEFSQQGDWLTLRQFAVPPALPYEMNDMK